MSSDNQKKPTLLQIIFSVFAAAVGVSSEKRREQDFKQVSYKVWIIAGIVFTAAFVGALLIVVSQIVS